MMKFSVFREEKNVYIFKMVLPVTNRKSMNKVEVPGSKAQSMSVPLVEERSVEVPVKVRGSDNVVFQCEQCSYIFKRKYHLNRHLKTCGNTGRTQLDCVLCRKTFNKKSKLNRHLLTHASKRHFFASQSKIDQCKLYATGNFQEPTGHLKNIRRQWSDQTNSS